MAATKIGIIGYGYWGPNLTRNFYELPSAELVAIADLNEERLKQATAKYPHVIGKHSYKELFDLDLDAVVIATPPVTHFKIAKECMEHNLHVLVEKPMTLKSKDAEDLMELAATKNLTLMVGHIFEYNTAIHALKKYIDSGELGTIYYIDTARLSLGLFQPNSNVMWDLAPHDISILLYLLGKRPVSVSAHGMACVFNGISDVAYLNLNFPDNVSAYVHVSWLDPCKVRRITVVGSKKMAVFNDVDNENKIKIYDKGVEEAPEYTNGFGEFHCNYHSGDIVIPNIHFAEPLRQECQHFIDSIVNHTEPRSSGRAGMEVIKILEAAQHSMSHDQTPEIISW
jgi:predicted dehydrogenase